MLLLLRVYQPIAAATQAEKNLIVVVFTHVLEVELI